MKEGEGGTQWEAMVVLLNLSEDSWFPKARGSHNKVLYLEIIFSNAVSS